MSTFVLSDAFNHRNCGVMADKIKGYTEISEKEMWNYIISGWGLLRTFNYETTETISVKDNTTLTQAASLIKSLRGNPYLEEVFKNRGEVPESGTISDHRELIINIIIDLRKAFLENEHGYRYTKITYEDDSNRYVSVSPELLAQEENAMRARILAHSQRLK